MRYLERLEVKIKSCKNTESLPSRSSGKQKNQRNLELIYSGVASMEKCIQSSDEVTHKEYVGRLTPANTLSRDSKLTCSFPVWTVWVRQLTTELLTAGLKITVLVKVQLRFLISFVVLFKKLTFQLIQSLTNWQLSGKSPSLHQSEIQGMIHRDHLF